MESATHDGSLNTTPRAPRAAGAGLWTHSLIVIGLAVTGMLASALLIWVQVVAASNSDHRAQLAQLAAAHYAGVIDARVAALRGQMDAFATAPDVVAASARADRAELDAYGDRLAALFPFADRVEVIPRGEARLDLNAEVPISFAALNLIRRAESAPYAGPEGIKLDNQVGRFYVARPITRGGSVSGVLFVAVAAEYFLAPLKAAGDPSGKITLQQRFEDSAGTTLLEWGEAGSDGSTQHVALAVPHWTLSFESNPSVLGRDAAPLDLLTPLAVALGLMLAGVLLTFSSLARKLRQDSDVLLQQLEGGLRGRREQPQRYRMALFAGLARDAARLVRAARESGADARSGRDAAATARLPASEASPDDEPNLTAVEDLLRDTDEPSHRRNDGRRTPPDAPASAGEDDFLEVSSTGSARDNFGIEVSEDVSPLAAGLVLEPEIFRAYDIRGITTQNLTEDVVYWIGRAFAAEALERSQQRVAVGRDGRHSSAPLRDALARGLTEGGLDVLDIGQVPTPVLYYATFALDTGTGIMITGSHNPPEYNGLKMVMAGETLAEGRIQALRRRIEDNRLPEGSGAIEQIELAETYLNRITDDVIVAQPLKVVVDCGNGVAGAIAPELIERLGCEVIPLYCDVDGDFPNHHPDPAEPKNLEDLITVVAAEHADLGLAFDGDGDRIGVVTASGQIIWPDKLLMLYAQDIVGRNPGADIIYDVKCSRHLNSLISDLGGRPIMWKTGHSHIKAKIKETGALLAGEFSGHICFGERWYGFDDALYSAARLLEILGGSEQTADELFGQFPVTFSTPELKIQTTERAKFEIMDRLAGEADFGDGTLTTIDGLRVDFADGWGLIRPSNTSPVLSLRFEADDEAALVRIQDLFQSQLTAIAPDLTFR